MSTINPGWLNQNSQRTYPFAEDSRLRPTLDGVPSEDYRFPLGGVLDLMLETSKPDDVRSVYMSTFTLAGGVATIAFSDVASRELLASASCTRTDDTYTPVNFTGFGKHDDIRGTVVFGEFSKVYDKLPDGIYSFEPEETTFEARCVRPSVPCVSGVFVTKAYGDMESSRLRGDVALIAGRNVHLDYDEADNAIIISADSRYDYNDKCDCGDADRNPVVTINGISADDVVIEGDDCVNVEVSDGRIKISDTCSKPCCGCAELTFLNEKSNLLTTALGKLENYSNNLENRLNEFVMNALLSERSSMKYV
jgi:hypothetical protein